MLPLYTVAEEEFFVPLDVVKSWGYKIASRNGYKYIKRIKKVPGEGPAYYPRFYLGKACYSDKGEARKVDEARRKEIENDSARFKTYQDAFVNKNCLYTISTDSNYFYLEFQPGIVKKLKEFAEDENSHNKNVNATN
jgi:hypothetical protein